MWSLQVKTLLQVSTFSPQKSPRKPTFPPVSGVMRAEWAETVNAAATMWPQKTWTGTVAMVQTSAATTGNVFVACASARRETTQRRGTAASSASVTTLTVTVLETSFVEVRTSTLQRVFKYTEI